MKPVLTANKFSVDKLMRDIHNLFRPKFRKPKPVVVKKKKKKKW